MKTCTKCKEEKPLVDFPKEQSRKDGHYPWCKPCLSNHRKVRYQKKTRSFFINNKTCSLCKEDKPRKEFRVYAGKTLHCRCISCEDQEREKKAEGKKWCNGCKSWKSLAQFYPSKRDKMRGQCKGCGEEYRTLSTVYERNRNRTLLKHYGITLNQYKEQLAKQQGCCPICENPFDENVFSYPVDHSHVDGKIRAILHDRCNRFVMWKHKDSKQLRNAADLLDAPLTDWIVPDEYLKGPKRKRRRRK